MSNRGGRANAARCRLARDFGVKDGGFKGMRGPGYDEELLKDARDRGALSALGAALLGKKKSS